MSEQGSGGEPSFRPSAEEKRVQETVMLNQEDLDDLVAQAQQEAPAETSGSGGSNATIVAVVVGVVVIVAVIVVILLASGS